MKGYPSKQLRMTEFTITSLKSNNGFTVKLFTKNYQILWSNFFVRINHWV